MTEQPLVSIIIPTYNRADLIGETLDSIIGQTYQNWECIVVDDGSTDNTEEVLNHYIEKETRISYYKRQSNYKPGGNGARNYGFDISKGEYINWFDSDDVMLPEKIEKQLNSLLKKNKLISITEAYKFENHVDIILEKHDVIYSENFFQDYFKQNLKILTQTPLVKKEIFKINNISLFDERLKAAQEWEFFCRIFYQVPLSEFDFINEVTVAIRHHANSITNNKNQTKIFEYYKARSIVRKYLQKMNNYDLEDYFSKYNFLVIDQFIRANQKKNIYKMFKNEFSLFNKPKVLTQFFFVYLFVYFKKAKSFITFRYV